MCIRDSKKERISQAVKWAMIYSALFFLLFFAVLEIAPALVLQIFETSEHMRQIAVPALRILTVSWLASIPSLVLAAFALLLQFFGNLNLIWLGFILAELAGIPLALVLWKKAWRGVF